jgi:hypothetical protein
MNETPLSDSAAARPADDNGSTPGQLQFQLNSALILVCVVSLTLTGYLFLQYRALRRERAALQPVVTRFQTETQPLLQDLNNKLVEFGKTNPDIRPLLDKYGVASPTNLPAPRR